MILNEFGLPETLPEIVVESSRKKPFSVANYEVRWWFARPVIGEVTTWCGYDMPDWVNANEIAQIECIGKATVHGFKCFELKSEDFAKENNEWIKQGEIRFYINQTNDYTRTIAAIEYKTSGLVISSFYDEHFIDNWGKEEPIFIKDEGKIKMNKSGEYITAYDDLMVCDRCNIRIGTNVFDCIRVFDLTWFDDRNRSILMESFITQEGRTILSRRYNAPLWGVSETGERKIPWNIKYPDSNRIIINGIEFVHWYDSASHLAF